MVKKIVIWRNFFKLCFLLNDMDNMQKKLVIFIGIVIVLMLVVVILLFQSYNPEHPQTGVFFNSLQEKVNEAWNAPQAGIVFESGSPWIPEGVDYVCFADLTNPLKGRYNSIGASLRRYNEVGANLFLYPSENLGMKYFDVQHLDIEWITRENNPYCIQVKNDNIRIVIEKMPGGRLVRLR
jgi:hypothetical protein